MAATSGKPESSVRLRPDAVVWRGVGDDIVALDLHAQEYLAVNKTGALLWPALADGASIDDLVGVLVAAFRVDGAQALVDVEAFLADLDTRGLLEWSERE